MLRRLSAFLAGALLCTLAFGQSVPNGTITQGQIWTVSQWNNAFQLKADVTNGTLTGPTVAGGTFTGPTISNPTITGGTLSSPALTGSPTVNGAAIPTVASPAFTGTPTIASVPIPTFPETPVESAAGATPVNFSFPAGNALRYGADPTGSTDSTAALIKAHSTGYTIYYPTGSYIVSSTITIPCGGIVGDGAYKSTITDTSTGTTNVYAYNCALAGVFRDVSINSATMTGGYAISVTAPSGEVSGMRFNQIVINGIPNGISFVAASLWSITASNFYSYTGDAITVNNTNNSDSGDSVISSCQFTSPGHNVAFAIHQLESGGLKIVGNKFNNGGVGILLDLGSGSTSDLIVTGNSFENAHFSGIQLQRSSGSAVFNNVVITGNQFLVSSSSGSSAGIFSNNGTTFLGNVTISGNLIQVTDTGSATGILLDYVTNASISGNTIIGAGGSSAEGILIGTHGTNINVGVNNVSNFSANIVAPTSTPATITGQLQLSSYVVASLPTCNTAIQYSLAVVTDALSPAYNGALTGGGAASIPVFCTGSAWLAH